MNNSIAISSDGLLPAGFAELEAFADWILPTEKERSQKRLASHYTDIRQFYESMLRCKAAWLAHLDTFTVKTMPEPERRLFLLALSLMEVAPAVEYFQSADLKNAVPAERLNILSPEYR